MGNNYHTKQIKYCNENLLRFSGKGNIAVNIADSEFDAGMYMYTLIADGKEIDTKRMILTK